MTAEYLLLYLVIGAGAGVIGGLLGIGGGVIVVPSLLFVFSLLGLPKDHIMHLVIGTSLACTAINALSATYFHNKHKKVDWLVVGKILPGVVLGSLGGSLMAKSVPGHFLQVIFGAFALCFSIHLIRSQLSLVKKRTIHPKMRVLSTWGFLVSCLSNLLGVGGGIFMVPLLTHYHFNARKVIGTSSCLSFCVSFLGALLFLRKTEFITPLSYGYIYLPAFFAIAVSGSITSIYGVKLAQRLSISLIRKIFAFAMFSVGVFMIFK